MCGIAGIYSKFNTALDKQHMDVFFANWLEMQERGTDAAGIFAIVEDRRGGRGILFYKLPHPASTVVPIVRRFVEENRLSIVHAIAHTRLATHGSPLYNRNNHPLLRIKGSTAYALVHNGIVTSKKCVNKYTETDTEEVLCSAIHNDFNISGSAAIMFMVVDMSKEYDPELLSFKIYRQVNPLMIVSDKEVLHMASTLEGGRMLRSYRVFDLLREEPEFESATVKAVEKCDTCQIDYSASFDYRVHLDDYLLPNDEELLNDEEDEEEAKSARKKSKKLKRVKLKKAAWRRWRHGLDY